MICLYKLKSGNILVVKPKGKGMLAYIMSPDGVMLTPEGTTDPLKIMTFLAAFKS